MASVGFFYGTFTQAWPLGGDMPAWRCRVVHVGPAWADVRRGFKVVITYWHTKYVCGRRLSTQRTQIPTTVPKFHSFFPLGRYSYLSKSRKRVRLSAIGTRSYPTMGSRMEVEVR